MPHVARLTIVLFLLIGVASADVFGQNNNYILIHTGSTTNWSWSSNSEDFVFDDFTDKEPETDIPYGVPTYPGPYWYEYSVSNHSLARSSLWPLQPLMTDAQFDEFEIVGAISNTQSFIFVGPTGLSAYVALLNGETNPIGITDGRDYVLAPDAHLVMGFASLEQFTMRWNDVGTSVAGYNNLGNTRIISFVTDFGSPQNLQTPVGANFLSPLPGRSLIFPNSAFPLLFDVANSSDEVLMSIEDGNVNNANALPQLTLMLWNPLTPETSIVFDSLKDRGIIAAAFNQNNDNEILFLDSTGLYLFGRPSETITLLNSDYNISNVDRALFSPNGRWLALGLGVDIYMLDVAQLISSSSIDTISLTDLSGNP